MWNQMVADCAENEATCERIETESEPEMVLHRCEANFVVALRYRTTPIGQAPR